MDFLRKFFGRKHPAPATPAASSTPASAPRQPASPAGSDVPPVPPPPPAAPASEPAPISLSFNPVPPSILPGAARPAPAPRAPQPVKVELTLLALEGPSWLSPESPAAELYPAKANDALLVAFHGASAELPPPDASGRPPLADAPARLVRALPLFLAEQVELHTSAMARTLVPWLVKPHPGFILGGSAWDDATASRHARGSVADDPADYVVVTHLRCLAEPWTIELRLVRTIDAACLATASVACPSADPGLALPELVRELFAALAAHAEIASTAESQGPAAPAPGIRYLLALEQLLAVRTAGIDPAKSTLRNERELLDGQLAFCAEQPDNLPLRLILANTLGAMKRARPEIVADYRERVERLDAEHPLPEPARAVTARLFAAVFAA